MSRSAYDPQEVEPTIARRWERAKAFSPPRRPRRGRKTFSVVLPPPNITGSLHMGHALNGTMQDALVRYHRMKGDDTVWIPGTDHAGIATQNVVERELQKEGRARHDLGREKFVERVWAWKEKYGGIITQQLRRLGASCDWSRERFTLDEGYARAVQEAFIHYANKGLIYRGERIINWCPRCASAISDLEVKHEERDETLYFIRYPFAEGVGEFVAVATTRPETMLGDVAVAVHVDDDRYCSLVGKKLRLPLLGKEIPIVQDSAVDPKFGTGAVKVTPNHDFADAEIAERHGLARTRNVIREDGKIEALHPEVRKYHGQTVAEARAAIVADLREGDFLEKEEPYRHSVAVCDRCGSVIEPLISRQWFLRMEQLAKPALKVIEDELIAFHPHRWKKASLDWLLGVKDWCISRQLWWGHRLPVWYCQTGKNAKLKTQNSKLDDAHVVFSVAKPKTCPECGGKEFAQDPDVLDTWFSSALWPFATLGWPETSTDLRRFYPTSVLVTAPDILHLWVARMVFSGLEFMSGKHYLPAKYYGKRRVEQQIPFRDVIIHPIVLTLAGKRMSKSKGVVVDPLGLIDAYGADATRFGLLLQLREDQQALRFDENAVRAARNFINKLWNIARFLEGRGAGGGGHGLRRRLASSSKTQTPSPFDRWILSRLSETARAVTADLEAYRFGAAARALHDFVWDDFADWYIEVSKVPGMADANVARQVFVEILRLLHPFTPFVSEYLWRDVGEERMLIISAWPAARSSGAGAAAAGVEVRRAQKVVQDVRSARMLLGIPAARKLRVRIGRPGAPLSLFPAIEFLGGCVIDMGKAEDWVQVPSREGALIALHRDDLVGADVAGRLAMAERRTTESRRQIEKLEQQLRAMRQGAPRGVITGAERALAARRREFAEHEASVAALRALAKNP